MATARMIVVGIDGATIDHLTSWIASGTSPACARLLAEGAHAALCAPRSGCDALDVARVVGDVAAAAGKRVRVVRSPIVDGFPCDEVVAAQHAQLARAIEGVDQRGWDLMLIPCGGFAAVEASSLDPRGADVLEGAVGRVRGVIDEGLGEIAKQLDEETELVVVASQGAGTMASPLVLAAWLEESGFLTRKVRGVPSANSLGGIGAEVYGFVRALRRSGLDWLPKLVPQRLLATGPAPAAKAFPAAGGTSVRNVADVEWSTTRVYGSAVAGELRVNLRGREAHGLVVPEDFPRVCDEVSAALLARIDPATGDRIVQAVHRRHAAVEAVDDGPDLIVETAHPAAPGHGFVLLAGPRVRRGATGPVLERGDLTATLLHLLGLPAPSDVVGTVASSMIADGQVDARRNADRREVDGLRAEAGCP